MSIRRLDAIKWRIAASWKFVLSFRKRSWGLRDYPISVIAQRTDLDLGPRFKRPHAYLARVVNWWSVVGSGDTPQEAMRALTMQFETITAEWQLKGKPMPRPGTSVPVEWAPRTRVGTHPELADDFIRRILGLDWAWISDESSLWDFHTDETNGALYDKIKDVYGVDASGIESGNLGEILDLIAEARS
jgi:hypothetical protein